MSKLEMQQCVLGQVFTNCYFSESISYAGKTGGDPSDTWSF